MDHSMPSNPAPYFTPGTFQFLKKLAKNNNREWFLAHKAEYEGTVKEPCLRFIADLAEQIDTLNKAKAK